MLRFQLHRIHIGDDVALLFGGGGQIQHKAGIKVCQHFQTEIGTGMVALVHNYQRVQLIDDLKQGGFVSILDGIFRLTQHFGELRQIAVFLIGFQPLFAAATEGVIGEHHDGKLLRHRSGIEVLAVQQLLLGVYFHPAAEIHINFLPVIVIWVFEALDRLRQNCIRRYKPDHCFGFGDGQRIKHRADGVAGQKSLSAAGGYLETEIGHTGQNILIAPQCWGAFFLPEQAECRRIVLGLVQQLQIAGQIRNDCFLIAFQFHAVTLLTVW